MFSMDHGLQNCLQSWVSKRYQLYEALRHIGALNVMHVPEKAATDRNDTRRRHFLCK